MPPQSPNPHRVTSRALMACFLLGFAAAGCSRKRTPPPLPPVAADAAVAVSPSHRADLAASVSDSLAKELTPLFLRVVQDAPGVGQEAPHLAEAMGRAFAHRYVITLREGDTFCQEPVSRKCLVAKIYEDIFTTNTSLVEAYAAALAAASPTEPSRGIGWLSQLLQRIGHLPEQLDARSAEVREALATTCEQVLTRLDDIIQILVHGKSREELPWLTASFFEGRRFLLTTGIEEASHETGYLSAGSNLSALHVRLKVADNTLYVFNTTEGRSTGSEGEDLVAGFPLVAQRTASDGRTFFQVDFSNPKNKNFLESLLARRNVAGTPFVDTSVHFETDLILPQVAHRPRTPLAGLPSGQYFDASDKTLILDNRILFHSNAPFGEDSFNDALLGRNDTRPTVRMILGLTALDESDATFAREETISIADATDRLLGLNVAVLSSGSQGAAPWFSSGIHTTPSEGRAVSLVSNVAKADLRNDFIVVTSRNTPAAVVPVLQASVHAWRRGFEAMKRPEGLQGRIRTLTEEEFVTEFGESLRLPQGPLASTDPRVNMIKWDDTHRLTTAWASHLANPTTGRLLSGDVFIAGKGWAEAACFIYMERQWKAPAGGSPVIPRETRQRFVQSCDTILANLGILPSPIPAFAPRHEEPAPAEPVAEGATPALYEAALNRLGGMRMGQKLRSIDRKLTPNSTHGHLCKWDGPRTSEELLELAANGSPAIDESLVKSPSEAALSILKSVVTHELGHVFGLRHNFMGSTQEGEGSAPLPTHLTSNSVMDYNDLAFDIMAGRMNSYSDAENGAAGLPELGIYDAAALGAAYGLDTSALKIDAAHKIPFCTDQDASLLSNCQPFDYGKDFRQNLLAQMNEQLAFLRTEGIGGGFNAVDQMQQSAALVWYEIAHLLSQLNPQRPSGSQVNREEVVQMVRLLAYGELPPEGSSLRLESAVSEFQRRWGLPLVGVMGLIGPQDALFTNPDLFLRSFDKLVAGRIGLDAFAQGVASAQKTYLETAGRFSDARFVAVLPNLRLPNGTPWNFQAEVVEAISRTLITEAGTEVSLVPFGIDSGNAPVTYTLPIPFFRHEKNTIVQRNDNGVFFLKGGNQVHDFDLALSALAIAAPGAPTSPSANALRKQRVQLGCLLELLPPAQCVGVTMQGEADASGTLQWRRIVPSFLSEEAKIPSAMVYAKYAEALSLAEKPMTEFVSTLFSEE